MNKVLAFGHKYIRRFTTKFIGSEGAHFVSLKSDNTSAMRQMLKLQEQTFGTNSVQVAHAMCNLGGAYADLDDFGKAQLYYERACEILESLEEEVELAKATALLEDVKRRRSTPAEDELTLSHFSIPVYVKPDVPSKGEGTKSYVDDVKSVFTDAGSESPVEPVSPEKLKEQKAILDAILACKNEISHLKQRGSGKTNQLADLLVELASLYNRSGQVHHVEPLLVEALTIRELVYGSNHLSVSADLKNLGRMYFASERYPQAEQAWKKSLAIREAFLGPFHPQVADVADLYAKLLIRTERFKEAEELEARVEESRHRYRSDWDDYKKTALKAMEIDNWFYAQALWLAAMDEASGFEDEDPRLVTTLENLAHVYWKREKYDKAEPLCKRILNMSEKLLGKDHIDVARAANNLALVCERQSKYTEAAVLYQEALRVMELTLGTDHADVLNTRESHSNAIAMNKKHLEQKLQKIN